MEAVENYKEIEVCDFHNLKRGKDFHTKAISHMQKLRKSWTEDAVFKEAGFDTSTGEGKALKNLYDGELQADAIKQMHIMESQYDIFRKSKNSNFYF